MLTLLSVALAAAAPAPQPSPAADKPRAEAPCDMPCCKDAPMPCCEKMMAEKKAEAPPQDHGGDGHDH